MSFHHSRYAVESARATPCNKVCPGTALASAMCEFEGTVREELIELERRHLKLKESAMHYQLVAECLEDNARQQRSSRCSELPVLHAELQALLKKIRLSFGREMLSHAASAFDNEAMQTKPPSLGLKTLEVHAENLQAASAQLSVLRTRVATEDGRREEALQRANLMLRPWLHGVFRAKASDTAIERPARQRHHDEHFALSRHGANFAHDMQHVASRKREALPAAAGVVQR